MRWSFKTINYLDFTSYPPIGKLTRGANQCQNHRLSVLSLVSLQPSLLETLILCDSCIRSEVRTVFFFSMFVQHIAKCSPGTWTCLLICIPENKYQPPGKNSRNLLPFSLEVILWLRRLKKSLVHSGNQTQQHNIALCKCSLRAHGAGTLVCTGLSSPCGEATSTK